MDNAAYWGILVALFMLGVALLLLIVFGIRSLIYGKVRPLAIAAVFLPFIIFGILRLVGLPLDEAGVMTALIMLGLALLGLLFSGLRGLVGIQ